MTLAMCSIYDCKADAWHTPLFFQSPAAAVRSFGDAVNADQGDFFQHPEDYTLFHLANFDPNTGTVFVLAAPVSLAVGVNLSRRELKAI